MEQAGTVEKAIDDPLPPARPSPRPQGVTAHRPRPRVCRSRAPTGCSASLAEPGARGPGRAPGDTGREFGLVALGLGALEREPVVAAARPVLEAEALERWARRSSWSSARGGTADRSRQGRGQRASCGPRRAWAPSACRCTRLRGGQALPGRVAPELARDACARLERLHGARPPETRAAGADEVAEIRRGPAGLRREPRRVDPRASPWLRRRRIERRGQNPGGHRRRELEQRADGGAGAARSVGAAVCRGGGPPKSRRTARRKVGMSEGGAPSPGSTARHRSPGRAGARAGHGSRPALRRRPLRGASASTEGRIFRLDRSPGPLAPPVPGRSGAGAPGRSSSRGALRQCWRPCARLRGHGRPIVRLIVTRGTRCALGVDPTLPVPEPRLICLVDQRARSTPRTSCARGVELVIGEPAQAAGGRARLRGSRVSTTSGQRPGQARSASGAAPTRRCC